MSYDVAALFGFRVNIPIHVTYSFLVNAPSQDSIGQDASHFHKRAIIFMTVQKKVCGVKEPATGVRCDQLTTPASVGIQRSFPANARQETLHQVDHLSHLSNHHTFLIPPRQPRDLRAF